MIQGPHPRCRHKVGDDIIASAFRGILGDSIVSDMFQSILVAADRYRGSNHVRQNAVALAKRLRASLRLVYMVDF